MNEAEARQFWGLEATHPIAADGIPHDEQVGDFHVTFETSFTEADRQTAIPSYNLHDVWHKCYLHCHEYKIAILVAGLLSLAGRMDPDLLLSLFETQGLRKE